MEFRRALEDLTAPVVDNLDRQHIEELWNKPIPDFLRIKSNNKARENSYPSETAQNEHNIKRRTAPVVPGDRINDITCSTFLCFLHMSNA